jgi:hypothetical protein
MKRLSSVIAIGLLAALAEPLSPIPAAWNCDGTHPNAAGCKVMGEFVDLKLFD